MILARTGPEQVIKRTIIQGGFNDIGQVLAMATALAFGSIPHVQAQVRPVPPAKRIVTQGLAKTVIENLFKCGVAVSNHRISAIGTIAATDGTVLTVPVETLCQKGPQLPDLFDECS